MHLTFPQMDPFQMKVVIFDIFDETPQNLVQGKF